MGRRRRGQAGAKGAGAWGRCGGLVGIAKQDGVCERVLGGVGFGGQGVVGKGGRGWQLRRPGVREAATRTIVGWRCCCLGAGGAAGLVPGAGSGEGLVAQTSLRMEVSARRA